MLSNTRCPVCASTFSIAPEVLAAAGGWVRCGRCANVFDAGAHRPENPSAGPLQAAAPGAKPSAQSAPKPVLPSPGPVMPTGTAELSVTPDALDPALSERRLKRIIGKLNRSLDRVIEATARSDTTVGAEPTHPDTQAPTPRGHELQPISEGLDQSGANPLIERRTIKRPPTESGDAESASVPAAVREPMRGLMSRPWGSGAVQALVRKTALASLLLTLGLQVVLAFRSEAATHYPGVRPALQGLCALLTCELPALADLDHLSVESTGFQLQETPAAGSSHQFSWHVRNLALYPVKAPALELTLTDALDRPVLRKVFLPAGLGLVSQALEADGTWVGEVPVRVTIPVGTPPIAGYRVTAFYP